MPQFKKNTDSLSTYLNTLNHRFTIIAVTENGSNDINEYYFTPSGYNSVGKNLPSG